MRTYTIAAFGLALSMANAQDRATCIFGETFDGPDLPANWTFTPDSVQQQTSIGDSTGTRVLPWRIGDAASANADGYFPVPDLPLGNHFAMANDDAPPCNCDMNTVALISPMIDLTVEQNVAVEFRAYNDGRPQHGQAWLDASSDGNTWTSQQIPEVLGAWQTIRADLSAYDGGPLYLRFRWSDANAWASGFAIDDVCVYARAANDLSLLAAFIGDPTISAYDVGARSLEYTQLPLQQQLPLTIALHIFNRGMNSTPNVRVDYNITLNGGGPSPGSQILLATMPPGTDTVIAWNTGWTAGSPGIVNFSCQLAFDGFDDHATDNLASRTYVVTDAGNDHGNNAMAIDNDLAEATIDNGGFSYSTGCRFELNGGSSVIHGVGVRLSGGTEVGGSIHALVMDAQLNLLSSSAQRIITQQDIDLSYAGGTVYVPLDSVVNITDTMDVIALIKMDADTNEVRIAAGGIVPEGAAWKISASNFDVSFPLRAPIVRIYLSDAVTGIVAVRPSVAHILLLAPNPTSSSVVLSGLDRTSSIARIEVFDAMGRLVRSTTCNVADARSVTLDVSAWSPGCYAIHVSQGNTIGTARLVVIDR